MGRCYPSRLSARSFFRDPLGYVDSHADGQALVHMAFGRRRYVLVREPDAIWRVLVTDASAFAPGKWKRRVRRALGPTLNTLHGAEHRERRQVLQPSLARQRIEEFAPQALRRAERAQAQWSDGARIHLREHLDRIALEVAGDALLAADLAPESAELARALRALMARLPRLVPPVAGTERRRCLDRVTRSVDRLVGERRGAANGDDLIGALLAADLPADTVRSDLIAMLLAAVDEPPSALEAAWYLLARHPAAERRLHDELDATIGARAPEPADLAQLPFLDAVLRETLRLFPPARHIDRCPMRDVELAGARIPAGTNVIVSPFVTHRESGLHERARDFDPTRWLEPNSGGRRRGAYLPFGSGVHTCIGEPLARLIMTATFVTVASRWRLGVAPDAPLPVPRAPRLDFTLERR
jgi:cytochrome P450